MLSGFHWRESVRTLEQARVDVQAAKVRFDLPEVAEKPAHQVTLTTPFYMGKFTVTQEQWQRVMGQNPSKFKGKDNPVETVLGKDVQNYCQILTDQMKQPVRLPTEQEWEFACRAGTTTSYFLGDAEADLARVAWYSGNSQNATHPVGQKESNAFGLYDMHGNVWQWCQDWGEADYSKSPSENPQGSAHGAGRLMRGGSWCCPAVICRSDFRGWYDPDNRRDSVGFRVVVPASK